jgi:hypothetical protein
MNKAKVFIVNYENQAKHKVYFCDYENQQKNHQIISPGVLVKYENQSTIKITRKNFPTF